MSPQAAVDLGREAMLTALVVGAPILVAGMLIGLVIGLLQAMTQVQDQTVSFVPKLVGMVAVLGICLPWILEQLVQYSEELLRNLPGTIGGP